MRSFFIIGLFAAAALIAGCPAHAGPLIIAPTTLEIAAGRQSTLLTVTNASDEPVDLQFRAYAWDQAEGADRMLPTTDLVISPAIVTVAPHKKQVFRVFRVRTAWQGAEPSYRLRLNELPRPGSRGVAINLEFSLPLFVTTGGAAPSLSWSRAGATVSVTNTGNRRVRFSSLAIADGEHVLALSGASSSYLLAGARRAFALPPGGRVTSTDGRLVGSGDTGRIDVAASDATTR